ncbi:ComEC/Rec2 family competence protein [Actinoallomurus iriomotensis]|uniref:Membrane protein n=1 Tax=Actinoallomurus iriomotensis TaxID=478107 RepID=A0A9W6W3J1_9ACTN|nr:ComEC/Rec2 family competence protein [Actinoallomurus iriomotensis]GLY90050.1 membrane protein [Actinoallomurus iriomotensis]
MSAPPPDDGLPAPAAGEHPPPVPAGTGAGGGPWAAVEDVRRVAGPDLRLVGPAVAAWLAALVLLAASPAVAYLVAAASLATAVALLVRSIARALSRPASAVARRRSAGGVRTASAAVLICAAASALGVGSRLAAVGSGPVRGLAKLGSTARLDGVVTGDPKAVVKTGAVHHRETVIVPVRVEQVGDQRVRVPVLVLATAPAWKGLLPSRRIRFTARLTTPERSELLAAIALVRGPPTTLGAPSSPQRVAGVIRLRLRAAASHLPGDQRGVLPGLVDGDTSLLRPDLADAFEKAGLTHLMAVSGENLSLVLGAVLGLGRFAGLGRRAGPLLAGAAIVGFVVLARPSPSVLRAAVMGGIALIAVVGGRERQGVPALCAAVLVLVLADPELARSYGFALSASATAGILVLAPAWRDRLSGRMPRGLAEALAVSAAAHLACAPLLAMLGTGVSLSAIPANLLAAPAVAPATLLGVLAATVAPFSLGVARLVVWPAGLAVGWITGVARFFASMPYAVIGWPAGLTGVALLFAAVVVGALVFRRPVARGIAAAVLAGVVLVAVGMHVLAPSWPPRGWLFVVCDVGQGDGLALFTGPGQAAVVDAGPDPLAMDRCLRDLGVHAVPLLVLTHPHADHIDGLPGVLRGRAVGTVVISPDSDGEERHLLAGRTPRTAGIGDVWTVGPLTLSVLGPLSTLRVTARDTGTTVNNASVVMLARWPDLSVMLSGDVEIEAQRELLAAGVPAAQILKIPHHGSSHQDPAFLAAVRARVAIASVGADNDYGHPAPSTMSTLTRLGERVYRTDRDGDVAVIGSRAGPAVVTRRNRP